MKWLLKKTCIFLIAVVVVVLILFVKQKNKPLNPRITPCLTGMMTETT